MAALGGLLKGAEGNEEAGIEVVVLTSIQFDLAQDVGKPLGQADGPLPDYTVFPALRLVCETQRALLAALLKPAQAGFMRPAKEFAIAAARSN